MDKFRLCDRCGAPETSIYVVTISEFNALTGLNDRRQALRYYCCDCSKKFPKEGDKVVNVVWIGTNCPICGRAIPRETGQCPNRACSFNHVKFRSSDLIIKARDFDRVMKKCLKFERLWYSMTLAVRLAKELLPLAESGLECEHDALKKLCEAVLAMEEISNADNPTGR